VSVAPLFKDGREDVRLERWVPSAEASFRADGGAELLILDGGASECGEAWRRHSWLRVPDGGTSALRAGPEGANICGSRPDTCGTSQPRRSDTGLITYRAPATPGAMGNCAP
jgi:hypothetical protein